VTVVYELCADIIFFGLLFACYSPVPVILSRADQDVPPGDRRIAKKNTSGGFLP
jgi:hypothetical protein